MERSTVADLIEATPDNDSAELLPVIDRLFALEDEINDEFLGLACVRFVSSWDGGHLIVTDTRLILVGDRGRLTVIEFSEIDSIVVGPGAKKIFGGYERSYLTIHRRQGDTISLVLPGDHNWAMRTATTAQEAHDQYRLKGSSTRPRSVATGTTVAEYGHMAGGDEPVTLSADQVRELDLLLTTLSVYAEARSNDDMVRRVEAFTTKVLRQGSILPGARSAPSRHDEPVRPSTKHADSRFGPGPDRQLAPAGTVEEPPRSRRQTIQVVEYMHMNFSAAPGEPAVESVEGVRPRRHSVTGRTSGRSFIGLAEAGRVLEAEDSNLATAVSLTLKRLVARRSAV